MESSHRVLRAIGFGAASGAGLYLAGCNSPTFASSAFVVAVLFLLNVFTYWASSLAALALIWGGLVAAGVAPGVNAIMPLGYQAFQTVSALKIRNESVSAAPPTGQSSASDTLAAKLANLKEACDKSLLSKDECDASRAKIVSEFVK